MSKDWFPVIDYEKCIECGACVEMCPSDVYNKELHPHPVVINPNGCGTGCSGCGSACPTEAIRYETTIADEMAGCCAPACSCTEQAAGCASACSCGCEEK